MPAHGRALLNIAKVLLLLGAVELLVRGPFIRDVVVPKYLGGSLLARHRMSGHQVHVLFDGIRSLGYHGRRIAFLGDSTMDATGPDAKEIAYLTVAALRAELGRDDLRAIHSGIVGLYANDAALLATKLVSTGIDVLVYGLELRAFPHAPRERFTTSARTEMSAREIGMIGAAGGGAWLARTLSGEQMLGGMVHSSWATYAYRRQLKDFIWERAVRVVVSPFPAVEAAIRPAPRKQPPYETRTRRPGGYEWSREEYSTDGAMWEGFELVGRLCQRYMPGRCVVYAGPVNPIDRDRLAEPGLYEGYLAHVRVIAGRYGLIWRDFTDAMQGNDFRSGRLGARRDAIHLNEGGRAKLARLLVEPVAEALRNAETAEVPDSDAPGVQGVR